LEVLSVRRCFPISAPNGTLSLEGLNDARIHHAGPPWLPERVAFRIKINRTPIGVHGQAVSSAHDAEHIRAAKKMQARLLNIFLRHELCFDPIKDAAERIGAFPMDADARDP
jgi:hypothetical protein